MQLVEPHDLFMSQLKSVVVSTDQLLAEMHNLSCLPGMSCTASMWFISILPWTPFSVYLATYG